jgi:hypothetical protein
LALREKKKRTMIVNPYLEKHLVQTYAGTRLLRETLGVIGMEVWEGPDVRRRWTIQSLFAPIPGRALGGIRAKLIDGKGYVSFCNQRDLEVLLGAGEPGRLCRWLGTNYPDMDDPAWIGLCVDEDDLLDDLYERELLLRGESPAGVLEKDIELRRFYHVGNREDIDEVLQLIYDGDPLTGHRPDSRFETLGQRWGRLERRKTMPFPWVY